MREGLFALWYGAAAVVFSAFMIAQVLAIRSV